MAKVNQEEVQVGQVYYFPSRDILLTIAAKEDRMFATHSDQTPYDLFWWWWHKFNDEFVSGYDWQEAVLVGELTYPITEEWINEDNKNKEKERAS